MDRPTITIDEVRAAARRLAGIAHRTPVVRSAALDGASGNTLFLKCENLQRVGAFKFRGAYNALSKLSQAERDRGVVAFSSGNHAQGVALAARELGMRATIVMPVNANPLKLAATRGYGAEVVEFDPATRTREEIAGAIQAERGAVLIPPFDHPDVIAGQGTAALELFEDVPDLDIVVAPAGGGGLLSGTAIVARALSAHVEVVGAEPAAGDDWQRSFAAGEPVTIPAPQTIADGLKLTRPGSMTWPIVHELVSRFVTVGDAEIARTMRLLFERTKLVVEPAGAVPVAAAVQGKLGVSGKRIGLIVSGGNVDVATFAEILADPTLLA